jgi:MerR family transcriptional regulator/heat shock protein HspR
MRRDPKAGLYMIGVVAARYEIHPQTLRLYEREGLLRPSRTEGKTRLYSDEDLERLEFILSLTRDLGVNVAGVEVVLNLRERLHQMQQDMERTLQRYETLLRAAGVDPAQAAGAPSATGLVKVSVRELRKKV